MNEPHPLRREPPAFRRVFVRRRLALTPRMVRVTFGGEELEGLVLSEPASSVRLLLPSPLTTELVIPTWNGNEFLLPDGRRPALRTFTPRLARPPALELDLDIVLHERGVASDWARSAAEGDPAAVSGPGRGYSIDIEASSFLLGGDESAIPAISQLLEALPPSAAVRVHIEVAHPDARLPLPEHPLAVVEWHGLAPDRVPGAALAAAVRRVPIDAGTRVWVAGEAAAVQRIRTDLFKERGIPRAHATVRGYWKLTRDTDRATGLPGQ